MRISAETYADKRRQITARKSALLSAVIRFYGTNTEVQ